MRNQDRIRLRDILHAGFFRIARPAGIVIGGLGEERNVFFLDNLFQIFGYPHVLGKFLHCVYGCFSVFFLCHGLCSCHTHSLGNIFIFVAGSLGIVFHHCGENNGIGHTMGCIIECTQRMRHGVNNAKSHIGKAHACHILSKRHVLSAFRCVIHRAAKGTGNDFDGF